MENKTEETKSPVQAKSPVVTILLAIIAVGVAAVAYVQISGYIQEKESAEELQKSNVEKLKEIEKRQEKRVEESYRIYGTDNMSKQKLSSIIFMAEGLKRDASEDLEKAISMGKSASLHRIERLKEQEGRIKKNCDEAIARCRRYL